MSQSVCLSCLWFRLPRTMELDWIRHDRMVWQWNLCFLIVFIWMFTLQIWLLNPLHDWLQTTRQLLVNLMRISTYIVSSSGSRSTDLCHKPRHLPPRELDEEYPVENNEKPPYDEQICICIPRSRHIAKLSRNKQPCKVSATRHHIIRSRYQRGQ